MRWYFDFISPYAYLQSTRLDRLAAAEPVECIPVLFAGLLGHWGHSGPAELAPKRKWTFEQVTWVAHRDGIEMTMPSHHPFNPLPLLRLAAALNNDREVIARVFRWVWVEGNTPDDKPALARLISELGLTSEDIVTPTVKSAIKKNTEQAIEAGVFGVPTVQLNDRLFWGDDATEMALACASANGDESKFPGSALAAAASMKEGPGRQRASSPSDAPPVATSIAPRLPYQPTDLAEPAELVKAVRERRGGELLELDRMLLHSPALTQGWNQYLGAVRTQLSLDKKIGEMVICTVAILNGAEFEFGQHAPLFIKEGGTQTQSEALSQPDKAAENTDLFEPTELAALKLCIEMTRHVRVNDQTIATLREQMNDQAVVELVATIAAYNMVSRFLVALNIHDQSQAHG
ncbi:MAG: DsbA family protein [Burkholderiaceae bacterium]